MTVNNQRRRQVGLPRLVVATGSVVSGAAILLLVSASGTGVASGTAPIYAYLSKVDRGSTVLGLVRGTKTVVRQTVVAAPNSNTLFGIAMSRLVADPVWTLDGRYVVAIDHTNKDAELPGNTSDHSIVAVDAQNGTVRKVACPGCTSVVAVGGSKLLMSIDPEFASGEAPPAIYGDENKLPMMEVDLGSRSPAVQLMTDLPVSASPVEFVAGANGQVLVASKSDTVHPQELFLLYEDGSIKDLGPTSSGAPIGPVAASSGSIDKTLFAINGDWGAPNGQDGGNISLIDPASGKQSPTDVSVLAPMSSIQIGAVQIHIIDLWFDGGSLYATLSLTSGFGHGDPLVMTIQPSIWRLVDNRWRKVNDDKIMLACPLNATVRAVVVPEDPNTTYEASSGGTLYTESAGVRTFIASNVVAVATSPRRNIP